MSGDAALINAISSERASEAQTQANQQAMLMQWMMYQQSRKDYAPWREAGTEAINQLSNMVQQGPGKYTESPGYEFRLREGQRALEGSASARGNVLSGAAQKAAIRYGQDYATNDYDNFLARYYQSLTPYQSLAGVGMTATQGTTGAGMNATNQIGSYLQNIGNAQAANYINQANIASGTMNSMANNALAGYNAWRSFGGGTSAGVVPYVQSSGPTGSFDYTPPAGYSGTMAA